MVEPKSKKPVAPEREELSEAVGFVLKDCDGPVNVSNVVEKLKAEHPAWKLPERRVSKFVKRYMSEQEKKAQETDCEDTPINSKAQSKKFSSPSRSLRRLFSPKVKKKGPSVTEDLLGAASEGRPSSGVNLLPEPVVAECEDNTEEKDALNPIEYKNVAEGEIFNKDIAYETDHETVDSSNDCFVACSIM